MIAIIGGGIGGLALGHHLTAAGVDAVVLEAAARPGGVIGSGRVEGRVVERGPQRARLTPPLGRLIDDLGLRAELSTAPDLPLHVYVDGRLRRVPLDPRTALTTDLIGWSDRLRLLLEPLTRALDPGESAAQYFTRKLGRRTYERVIAPLFGGLYASDPADMRARHALASTLESLGVRRSLLPPLIRGLRSRGRAPACSFRGGLQGLTDALADGLGDRLRLAAPVREVRREGAGFRVDALHADRVVLACPADAAAAIIRPLAPDAAERLASLRYNPLALVYLLANEGRRALGYQVAAGEGMATRGVTFNHAMFGPADRDGLHTAFLGGSGRPELVDLQDDELGRIAADEMERVIGSPARPIGVHRTRIPAWDTTWDALDELRLPDGIDACASWRARPGITGRLLEAARLATRLTT